MKLAFWSSIVGWWLVPLAITIAVFIIAWGMVRDMRASSMDIAPLLAYGGATIISTLAWLVWALL